MKARDRFSKRVYGVQCIYYHCVQKYKMVYIYSQMQANRELSGRVLDSRPKGRGVEPHRRHCVVVLEQDTFILA